MQNIPLSNLKQFFFKTSKSNSHAFEIFTWEPDKERLTAPKMWEQIQSEALLTKLTIEFNEKCRMLNWLNEIPIETTKQGQGTNRSLCI